MRAFLQFTLTLLFGCAAGLSYAWFFSPIEYVDAHPSLLRSDFKEQYRSVIAAAYTHTRDLPRARARLELLADPDPIAELSAQAQRMVAAGESIEHVQPLVQLATDLKQGFASALPTATPFPIFNTPQFEATPTQIPDQEDPPLSEATPTIEIVQPTTAFQQTPLIPVTSEPPTPRPTFTPTAFSGTPFTLSRQEELCTPGASQSQIQFIMQDARGKPVAGVEINVAWESGEDRFFTGFKPDVGNGYADFTMQPGTVYNIRIVTGGSFVPNITAPTCTDPNGTAYTGSIRLTFQQ